MTRSAIARFCAAPTAGFLLVIGVLHNVVGLSGLRRAIEGGELPARFSDSHLVNWAFSGAAMSLLGVIVIILLPGLREGSRQAWRVALFIGVFLALFGAAGYLWVPTRPSVLIFLVFGALLAIPLVTWRREYSKP